MHYKRRAAGILLVGWCIASAQADEQHAEVNHVQVTTEVMDTNEAPAKSDHPALTTKFPLLAPQTAHDPNAPSTNAIPDYVQQARASGSIGDDHLWYSREQQEKMRHWMQQHPSQRYLVINIPAYALYLVESETGTPAPLDRYKIVWSSRVVVGSPAHPTPDEPIDIISLKYNPTWTPTLNIMRRNLFTSSGEWNWNWIHQHNFVPRRHGTAEELSWDEAYTLPLEKFYLVEPPGDDNSLGRLKFETNSSYHIYLHDTDAKWLFDQDSRAYSSGCVRVQNPFELAAHLANTPLTHIEQGVASGDTFWQAVPDVPVYFLYDIIEYAGNQPEEVRLLDDPYGKFQAYVDAMSLNYTVKSL